MSRRTSGACHSTPTGPNPSGPSALGGLANKPYSGSLTWDSTSVPTSVDGTSYGEYETTAYQFILDGVDLAKPITSRDSAIGVFNDADVFEDGTLLDGLALFAIIDDSTPIQRLFIGFLLGPSSIWDTLQLPGDLTFLSALPVQFAGFSDEVPFEGDENEIWLGRGTLAITAQTGAPVPEPPAAPALALAFTVLGIGSRIARVRRFRRAQHRC
ncbi:MAG: hypothetical protein IT169_16970 [Bryobacterales bacterium]|nr:hypothetical protein [Bryobacterales bacterium]